LLSGFIAIHIAFVKGRLPMDIDLEKEKANFIYRLELKKIFFDKFLLGILLVAAGVAANILIENYRSNLTSQRFVLEQRLIAINQIKAAHDDLMDLFDDATRNTGSSVPLTDKIITSYRNKCNYFCLQTNKFNAMLPIEFDHQMTYFAWLYTGAIREVLKKYSAMDENERIEHRLFINDVRQVFYRLCRESLGLGSKRLDREFTFEEWSFPQASQKGASAYYLTNFSTWKKNIPVKNG
jgi:hypothetical protein